MRTLTRCLLSTLSLCAVLGSVQAAEFTLAAGAGYRKPVAEAVAAFESATGDKVGQIFGNMGQITAQARESGVIGMICGDRAQLEKAQGLSFQRFIPFGAGKLVVGYRKGLTLNAPDDIAGNGIQRIAIPDEKAAIYGIAGRQYLQSAGLAAAVDPKLITVATVPQVTAYLARGEVDAGLLNATDAMGAGDSIGGFLAVDPTHYKPIRIDCGVLDEQQSSAFAAFLGSDTVRQIVAKYGM